ncbi:MAG: DUF2949 domain-containing protein [Crocosphaera sp.]|uniref:DUF2949 domain-containing protein n=1 Tax=Crocosphaera sp. TaxID=2729996 RepID=UPI002636F039|nr:DUF2949 domain-containing protein [Crocosphaera sp.]MDJ0579278.1 DUF2949 domain-containing protein [Crocosphaera sp.]
MPHTTYQQFLRFLHEELCLSADSIAIAQRSMSETKGPLPMLLWQYGLINLNELEKIYDWLDASVYTGNQEL